MGAGYPSPALPPLEHPFSVAPARGPWICHPAEGFKSGSARLHATLDHPRGHAMHRLVEVLEEAASEGVALEFAPLAPRVVLGRLPGRGSCVLQARTNLGPNHRLLPQPFGVPLLPLSNLAAQEFVQPLYEAARVGVAR